MGIEWWELPKWQREGRTGPGPAAPKYAKRTDRNKVRRGKPVGTNGPYSMGNGPQPKSRIPRSHGNANTPNKGCGKTAAVLLLAVLGSLAGLGYGAVEAIRAVVS